VTARTTIRAVEITVKLGAVPQAQSKELFDLPLKRNRHKWADKPDGAD
jgi:hypothetical protein